MTVIPIMGTGATDSAYLRAKGIPMYGVSGLFGDIADVRAHGRDVSRAAGLPQGGLLYLLAGARP